MFRVTTKLRLTFSPLGCYKAQGWPGTRLSDSAGRQCAGHICCLWIWLFFFFKFSVLLLLLLLFYFLLWICIHTQR